MTVDLPLFPPGAPRQRGNTSEVVELDPDIVEAVHRALWFLLPGDDAAIAGTQWTFEIASARSHALPHRDQYVAWLVTIADRESRRHRSLNNWQRRKTMRHEDSDDPQARARHVAEAMGQLTADERLALVLRLRVGAPPPVLAAALGVRLEQVAGVVNRALDALREHCDAPMAAIVDLPVPTSTDLPRRVQPLDTRQQRASNLNYGWQSNGFPTLTDFDRAGRRRAIAFGTAAAVALLIVGIWRSNPPERPVLIEPSVTVVSADDIADLTPPPTNAPAPPRGLDLGLDPGDLGEAPTDVGATDPLDPG